MSKQKIFLSIDSFSPITNKNKEMILKNLERKIKSIGVFFLNIWHIQCIQKFFNKKITNLDI